MIIAVGDTRVYKFPQSTIVADIYPDHAVISVLPDEREFILWAKRIKLANLQEVYPERTPENIFTTIVTNALQNGFLQVDEEIL